MSSLVENKLKFCPLYNDNITEYDCSELWVGVECDYLINDGLPHLMTIEEIRNKKHLCLTCKYHKK